MAFSRANKTYLRHKIFPSPVLSDLKYKKMEDNWVNIASSYPNEARFLRLVLGIPSLSLGLGLVAPIITLKKFV